MTGLPPAAMRIALPPAIDPRAFLTRDASRPVVDLDGETMGTNWHVRLVPSADFNLASTHAAITVRLDAINDQMSHWAPSSLLCGFNRSEGGSRTMLPPDFSAVMIAALDVAEKSAGAFDPAIGRLVDLWGFGPPGAVAAPPTSAMIGAARATSGWRLLDYDARTSRLRQPGRLALDLSGIAKGFAVDAIVDLLDTHGIGHCLVEIGGELAGRGVRPDGEPWWVDLEDPPGTSLPPLRIALHGLAVATSGNYRRGGHNLDPRTGRPLTNNISSVSVIHRSAMIADAWATALTVLGPVDGFALAAREKLAARMICGGEEHLSPALIAMLDG